LEDCATYVNRSFADVSIKESFYLLAHGSKLLLVGGKTDGHILHDRLDVLHALSQFVLMAVFGEAPSTYCNRKQL
ncbi:hypothetical protein RvY_05348, partial [Ramazzottius varieornatus]